MKIAVSVIILFALLGACASAEDDNNNQYTNPPSVSVKSGLETQQVSPGVTVVAPQGAQMTMVNKGLYVMESSEEYAARNFVDVNELIAKLGKRIDSLEKELYFMKKKMHNSDKGKVVTQKNEIP